MQNNTYVPASAAQINYLQRLGYTGKTEGLSNVEASALIQQYKDGAPTPQPQGGYQQQPQYQPQPQPSQGGYNSNIPSQHQMDLILQNNELATDLFNNLNELAGSGQLYIPKNYSVGNALKSAMFAILNSDQSEKLLACTNESKKQALTEYVIQGLDAGKKQAYFIPYGNKLTMMRSYFGDATVTKATGLVKDVYAVVIYEGDEIELGWDEVGREILLSHKTKFENRDNPIKGAYACAVIDADHKIYQFMTMKEIRASWAMSKNSYDKNKFQNTFGADACMRTCIRKLVKMIFNTSLNTTEQQDTLIGSYNRTTENEYDNERKNNSINAEVRDSNTNEVHQYQQQETASVKPQYKPRMVEPQPTPQPEEQPQPVEEERPSCFN